MPEQQHLPLESRPSLLSPDKRKWCSEPWEKRQARQPRIAVFQYAMNATRRPSNPDETIAYGYMVLNKFHDREPEAVLRAIQELDPNYFDSYPRKPDTELTEVFKKAIIAELARVFFRYGLAAYGKPGLRKSSDVPQLSEPLAAI